MKYKLLFTVLISFLSNSNINAQDVNASTVRLGPFHINMKHAEVETLIARKLSAKELKEVTDNYEKMIDVKFDNVVYRLHFYPAYDDNGKDAGYVVSRVVSEDARLKTKSGISIGQNKIDLIKQLSAMNITFNFAKYRKYDNDGKPMAGFFENISIMDSDANSSLILNINNEKVISFELYQNEDGC